MAEPQTEKSAKAKAALTAMGCGMGQGFLLSLPLDETAAFDLLADDSPLAEAARRKLAEPARAAMRAFPTRSFLR